MTENLSTRYIYYTTHNRWIPKAERWTRLQWRTSTMCHLGGKL